MKKAANDIKRWIPGILHDDVWNNGFSDLSCICRDKYSSKGYKALLDIQSYMEMGV